LNDRPNSVVEDSNGKLLVERFSMGCSRSAFKKMIEAISP
jgi:hypothetical protein